MSLLLFSEKSKIMRRLPINEARLLNILTFNLFSTTFSNFNTFDSITKRVYYEREIYDNDERTRTIVKETIVKMNKK